MRIKVGSKVICVDDSAAHPEVMKYFTHWPKRNEPYVVRGTRMTELGEMSLLLEGMVNPLMYNPVLMGKCEPGYNAIRFRLVDPQDDLTLIKVYESIDEEQLIAA